MIVQDGFGCINAASELLEMASMGSPYTWRWNSAMNNEATPGAAWRPFFDGNWQVSGDLTTCNTLC